MATVTELLTAEEFLQMGGNGPPLELVRGKIVPMNQPNFEHGTFCFKIAYRLGRFLETNDLGHITTNDSGIITERNPDTVRGPDIAFFSYTRLPREYGRTKKYPPVAPDIAIEVLSPSDEWKEVLNKVGEYLIAGVSVVCVVDPQNDEVRLYFPDRPEQVLSRIDRLTFPSILPGFELSLSNLLNG
jgi:Uma2 family endonuclease